MEPYLGGLPANPGSGHLYGQDAARAVDAARVRIRSLCGGPSGDVILTGSGTEAVLLGTAGAGRAIASGPAHAVFSAVEHRAGQDGAVLLEGLGWSVSRVAPASTGVLDPAAILGAVREDTVLVSVMHANNETGVVHPVAEIAAHCRDRGVRMHVDAVQSAGKIPVLAEAWGVDYVSVAAHKLGGPQGAAALWRRRGAPLSPMIPGLQEGGMRGGTHHTAGIVGFGRAADLVLGELEGYATRSLGLRERLESDLRRRIPAAGVTASQAPRLPNTTHLTFEPAFGSDLVMALDLAGFAVSAGSACRAGAQEPSPVLLAMGYSPERARTAVRVSLGRDSRPEEVDAFLDALAGLVEARRSRGAGR